MQFLQTSFFDTVRVGKPDPRIHLIYRVPKTPTFYTNYTNKYFYIPEIFDVLIYRQLFDIDR